MRTVVIKTWKQMEMEYGIASNGNINVPRSFTKEMERLMPKNRIISTEINYRGTPRWHPTKIHYGFSISEEMIDKDFIPIEEVIKHNSKL